ncbi:MAG: CoA transferase [Caulobacterales bacterium]
MTDALSGLRVVDFSSYRTGAQATQVFADFGAHVTMVEPPGGSSLRQDRAWPFWGRGKQSVEIDLRSEKGAIAARALVRDADVVISTFRRKTLSNLGLDYARTSVENPRLVQCNITGFGSSGALADLQGYEGIVAAKLGAFWALESLTSRPGPSFCTAAYASFPASQLAVQGVLAALYEREASGLGQFVETSLAKGLSMHDTHRWFAHIAAQQSGELSEERVRDDSDAPASGMPLRLLVALTRDNQWLQFSQVAPRLFKAMMQEFGLSEMLEDPTWKGAPDYPDTERRRALWDKMLSIVRERTISEWRTVFARNPNVWAEKFTTGTELLDHPQMNWNGFIAETNDAVRRRIRMPGAIARMSKTPPQPNRAAPSLGQNEAPKSVEQRSISANHQLNAAPLAGVTIVELGTFFPAPYSASLLADLGARVIKLEQLEGDGNRHWLPYPEVAGIKAMLSKECVAVDLTTPEGQEIAHRIVAKADILLQSYRAGAAERIKLDETAVRQINPDIIYQSCPGYGEDGPCGDKPAFAPTIGAAGGLAWRNAGAMISTHDDMTLDEIKRGARSLAVAVTGVGNADGPAAAVNATAMLLGLLARARGAGGQHIMTTMLSSVAHNVAELMIEYADAPNTLTADDGLFGLGPRYRLYEASDEWVFLAAPQEKELRRLVRAIIGAQQLSEDARRAIADVRPEDDADLTKILAAIFREQSASWWESFLCSHDVACVVAARGPVEARYLEADGVGEQCGLVIPTEHPIYGSIQRLAPMTTFSRSPNTPGDAGLLGQHTEKVLLELGYDSAAIAELEGNKIIFVQR